MNNPCNQDVTAAFCQVPRQSEQVLAVKVEAGSFYAQVTAWERVAGQWQLAFPAAAATIGRSGLTSADQKTEGDGCTPSGIYALGTVFGGEPAVATAMPYRQVTEDACWVDDPASPQYNCWVNGKPQAVSWEQMLQPDGLYRLGIVVEYNTTPVIAGKGSVILVHLWRGPDKPTQGCVALAESDLVQLVAWLEPQKQPVIILGSAV